MKNRILLADDDESVRKMVARVLESAGYSTVLASSSEEAIAEFREACPDLMLLDLKVPGEEGWRMLDQVYQEGRQSPLVVMTVWPDQSEHAARRGVEALLEKPLDLSMLIETIGNLLGTRNRSHSAVQ